MLEAFVGATNRPDCTERASAAEAKILLLERRLLLREMIASALGVAWPEARVMTANPDQIGRGKPSNNFDLCLLSVGEIRDDSSRFIDDLRYLIRNLPRVPIVIFGGEEHGPTIALAMRLGVRGYFPATTHLRVLLQGIRLIALGGNVL